MNLNTVGLLAALGLTIGATHASADVLFSDSFQDPDSLSSWSVFGNSAEITTAPDGSQALAFTQQESRAGGNIETNTQDFTSPSGIFTVSFDLYGTCGATVDCGFFISASGATVNSSAWILSDTYFAPGVSAFTDSENSWEQVTYTFTGSPTNLALEDWQASANGAPISFYLQNFELDSDPAGTPTGFTVGPVNSDTPVPEPTSLALLASAIAGLGYIRRRAR